MTIQFDEDKQRLKLDDLRKKDEEEYMKADATGRAMSYVNLMQSPVDSDALRLVPETKARPAKLAPFGILGKKVSVALLNPDLPEAVEVLKELTNRGYTLALFLASERSLAYAWDKYKELSFAYETKSGALDISNEQITDIVKSVKSVADIKKNIDEILAQKKSYRISRVVEIVIAGALALNASDIHIEPEEGYARLRVRLDGVLNHILDFDLDTFYLILSRVKLLSGMKINIKAEAQDGRFSVKLNDNDIEIRASVLPGAYAESIVLRLLNPKSIAVSMEELGVEPKLLKILEHEIAKPTGMILNTGPTGSGKTTTLYAFLRKVHNPQIKIITIENPIEYHLPGIVQTQTNSEKGYTFEAGLRAALRQDPDIIMVGEIRDPETASIAVNAALTGHLVFSTLHTNNAAGTFPRMIDLGVNPKVISSAVTIAMAQRLVRKLCVFCKKEIPFEKSKKELVKRIFDTIKDEEYQKLATTKTWEAVGCDKCNATGFKGRIGVFEAIRSDQNIERVVNENPSEREIKLAALPQGILSMQQDGIVKVLRGVTSLAELERVIDLDEENPQEKKDAQNEEAAAENLRNLSSAVEKPL